MINVEVERNSSESATNVLKRFTKRVQGAGVLNRVRKLRYAKRAISPYVKKKRTLKVIKRRNDRNALIKMGKIVENPHQR